MSNTENIAENIKTTIDVQDIPRREGLQQINAHHPKPLSYQFQAESRGEFTWDSLEKGPDIWRVRIGRTQTTAPRGCGH